MERKMRKGLVILIALALVIASMAGCSSQSAQPTTPAATATQPAATSTQPAATVAATAAPAPAATSLPIVTEPLTLTFYTAADPNVTATMKNYGEIACYKEMEKRTGIHIEFIHPSSENADDQFNLVLASGDLPDIMSWYWRDFAGGAQKHIDDGTILKLNDLVAQYAPNLSKILSDHPDWKKTMMTDEGSLYCFPQLLPDANLTTYIGLGIRKDWLDKLGLSVPVTIDDWHTVLTAFKEKDPNGNGQNDEIAYSPFMWGSADGAFWNGNAFLSAYGLFWGFSQENGKVKYGPTDPKYKDFLTLMNKWYMEGLIDKDFAAMSSDLFNAKFADNKIGAITCAVGSGIGQLMKQMTAVDPKFEIVGAPYPVLNAGDKPVLGQRDPVYNGAGGAISTKCKHPMEAAKWLDYCYSDEGHMLLNFGIEGVSYNMVNGYPKYTDLITKNPNGLTMSVALAQYCTSGFGVPRVYDGRYMEQYASLPQQQDALKVWSQPDPSGYLYGISLTTAESSAYSTKMADIETMMEDQFYKFVMGAQPISDFDKYIDSMKKLGIDDVIKIEQDALDRYNSRK